MAIAASSLATAAEWVKLDGVIPGLVPGETTIKRLDNYADADIKVNASSLVVNGGATAESVQSVLGGREAGWYSGTKSPNGNGGTVATVTGEGSTLLASAVSMSGGYTAAIFNELSASDLLDCDALKISFDTGIPSNTSRMGQPQNFGLFFSVTGSSDVVQVGETYTGLVSAVKESSISWELAAADYSELFANGGTFYLVLNSGVLNSTYATNTLPVSNFAVEGQFRAEPSLPEPSGASLALVGLGGLLLRRKRQGR